MNELTIIEQLGLIAQSAKAEYQAALMWVCLSALAAGALAGVLYAVRNAVSKVCKLILWLGPVGCIMAGPFICKMISFGGSKPTPSHLWRFEYTNGVTDNGSYCTNNQICARWTYNLAAMEYTLRAAYQDLTITNATGQCVDPLHQLPDAMVRETAHVWEVANATNMRVVVYAAYVPPPAVHTNGVYHLNGVMPSMDETPGKFVTPGVQIHMNLETSESWIITPTNAPPPMSALQSIHQEEDQE